MPPIFPLWLRRQNTLDLTGTPSFEERDGGYRVYWPAVSNGRLVLFGNHGTVVSRPELPLSLHPLSTLHFTSRQLGDGEGSNRWKYDLVLPREHDRVVSGFLNTDNFDVARTVSAIGRKTLDFSADHIMHSSPSARWSALRFRQEPANALTAASYAAGVCVDAISVQHDVFVGRREALTDGKTSRSMVIPLSNELDIARAALPPNETTAPEQWPVYAGGALH